MVKTIGIALIIMACGGYAPASYAQIKWDDLKFRVALDFAYDDNVSRAQDDDKFDDSSKNLTVSAGLPWRLGSRVRAKLGASVGIEDFSNFSGLSRNFAAFKGEIQFRASGAYGAPIWGLFASQGVDAYRSYLRDGYRSSIGISLRKPLTDKLFMFAALSYNSKDGRSKVFDTEEVALRAHFDWALSDRSTTYFGIEAREGEIVSTASPKLAFLDIADGVVIDDVFIDKQRFSYRVNARTAILTLGLNTAVGRRAALDLSYRAAYAEPTRKPPSVVSTESIYYIVNQVMLSFLVRF